MILQQVTYVSMYRFPYLNAPCNLICKWDWSKDALQQKVRRFMKKFTVAHVGERLLQSVSMLNIVQPQTSLEREQSHLPLPDK